MRMEEEEESESGGVEKRTFRLEQKWQDWQEGSIHPQPPRRGASPDYRESKNSPGGVRVRMLA